MKIDICNNNKLINYWFHIINVFRIFVSSPLFEPVHLRAVRGLLFSSSPSIHTHLDYPIKSYFATYAFIQSQNIYWITVLGQTLIIKEINNKKQREELRMGKRTWKSTIMTQLCRGICGICAPFRLTHEGTTHGTKDFKRRSFWAWS